MSNSGINSIYLFIAQKPNWQQEMDINGDGKIIQAECLYYIKENAGMVNLEDGANLNDIINKFWKSINSNTKGTSVASLDENEIDKLNQHLEYYENFEEFFKTVLAEFGGSDYNGIVGDYRAKWVESVRTSLLNSLEGFISKGGKPEDVAKFLNGELDDNYYDDPTRKNLKKLAMNMTTANAFARIYLDQNEATKGHEFGDLEKQIDYYIQTLGDNLSVSEIKTAVKKIVDDYVATSLPSWKCPEEEKYLPLNEIQAYTLERHLAEIMEEIKKEPESKEYQELYDSAIAEFIENTIKKANRGNYVELLKMDYKAARQSTEFSEIEAKIEEAKAAAEAEKDLRILPADFFKDLPDTVELFVNSTKSYSLPTSYTTPKGVVVDSSHISFSASNANATVNADGTVTIKGGSNKSTSSVVINVMYDGEIIGSKAVTIQVNALEDMIQTATWSSNKSTLPNGNGDYSDGDGGLRIWGGDGKYNDKELKYSNITFAELYNGTYNIELGTDAHEKYTSNIAARLLDLGNLVVTSLASKGLDSKILQNAMLNVYNSWKSNIHYMGKTGDKGCNKASQRENSAGGYCGLSALTTGNSGIYKGYDAKGNDQDIYMINFKCFVDEILKEYKNLL